MAIAVHSNGTIVRTTSALSLSEDIDQVADLLCEMELETPNIMAIIGRLMEASRDVRALERMIERKDLRR